MPVDKQRRTLLLTDVVDSTRLTEELGDEGMSDLWAAHDQVARELLEAHGGLEIDKTDGFLMLFERVDRAVAYTLAYHRALEPLGIEARAGLHHGEVVLRRTPEEHVARGAKPLEVDGLAKPTAARVMSVAVGRQTLLTPEAVAALGETPLRRMSHGHWRMKGRSEPVELFEIGDEGAPFAPPPEGAKVYRVVHRDGLWVPVREVPGRLPAERDAFVGRVEDLQQLTALVDEHRLVSLLGMGGTGKTRLALRFARTTLGEHPGGAWFCDLTEARSIDGIVGAVARALDLPLPPTDPVGRLGLAIAGRGPCLLILDNFEQVTPWAAETVGRWMDDAPEARFLVTSREVLGLRGEAAMALQPLVGLDAAALFLARARAAAPTAYLEDADAIAALVELLDGLPLAIELAAARVRIMAPPMLLQRMSQRFKLLTSRGGRPSRQATLRATLDWSWDLLTGDEQAALAQLAVFEGGFDLAAAEAVLELPELWPTDAVQSLVDKSLVQAKELDRFVMLVSVQAYAGEKLGGDPTGAWRRHMAWFAQHDSRALARQSREDPSPRNALAPDLGNFLAGCRRALDTEELDTAARLLEMAWLLMADRQPPAVATELAERIVALADGPTAVAGRRLLAETLVSGSHYPRAAEVLEQAIALPQDGVDLEQRVWLHQRLVEISWRTDQPARGWPHLERAFELCDAGDCWQRHLLVGARGLLRNKEVDGDAARRDYEEALTLSRAAGDNLYVGALLTNLGVLDFEQGRMDDARARQEEALPFHRRSGNRNFEARALHNLGNAVAHLEDKDDAWELFRRARTMARELGDRLLEAGVLTSEGAFLAMAGRLDEARVPMEAVLRIAEQLGIPAREGEAHFNLGQLAIDRGVPDEAHEHLQRALALYEQAGHTPMIQEIQGWMERLQAS